MNLAEILGDNGASLPAAMTMYGIDSALERAHFLAQCAHESGGFRVLVENLNYSADGLLRTWPTRFSNQTALEYGRKPERIANKVYANRFGNRNEASGDGWRFRGRGFLQLTFRDNYAAASQRLYGDDRLVLTPALVETPPIAAQTACDYWQSRHLGIHAMNDDLASVRRGVNGGLVGLDDCRVWLLRFKTAMGLT